MNSMYMDCADPSSYQRKKYRFAISPNVMKGFNSSLAGIIHKEDSEVAKFATIKSLFFGLPASWFSYTLRIRYKIKSTNSYMF